MDIVIYTSINFVSILHRYDRKDCRSVLDYENVISIHNGGRGKEEGKIWNSLFN